MSVRAVFESLTIALFLTLLWLPTADHVCKLDHAPVAAENRRLAGWPRFEGLVQSRAFIGGLESYFNDHFGFRNQLVRWNNHWKGQWFQDASGREVLIGREGWLFHSGDQMFEHWNRQKVWSEQALADWRRGLELRRDWLRARGIQYAFVVPPDKQTVYPEYLPEWMGQSSKPSKIQQLTQYLKGRSTVTVVDLSPALVAAKQLHATYLKTDTHWNQFGSFVAYRALLSALAAQCPGLEPLSVEAYEWRPVTTPGGDLARMLGRTDERLETQSLEPFVLRPLARIEVIDDPVRPSQRKEKAVPLCVTRNAQATGKLLVFCDSFAKGWHPYLGLHFKEVRYLRHADWDPALLEQEKPDVVIEEVLERGFNLRNPMDLAPRDHPSSAPPTP